MRLVLCGHVHQETDLLHEGVRFISSPSTCIQFEPLSRDFGLDSKGPGWRYLQLYADGRIETQVHRLPAGCYIPDGRRRLLMAQATLVYLHGFLSSGVRLREAVSGLPGSRTPLIFTTCGRTLPDTPDEAWAAVCACLEPCLAQGPVGLIGYISGRFLGHLRRRTVCRASRGGEPGGASATVVAPVPR